MQKCLLLVAFLFISTFSFSQVIQPAAINRLIALVQQPDSVKGLKGEAKTNDFGGTYYVSTLPRMSGHAVNIEEFPSRPKPFTLYYHFPVSKTLTLSSLKKELKKLIQASSIKGTWKLEGDYEIGLNYISPAKVAIHLVKDMDDGFVNLNIYSTEGEEE